MRFRVLDARGQVVGRLASQIAQVLMGKDKPTFCPWKDEGDVVVVVNTAEAELTGRKWDQKLYRRHTGYPGGLRERTAREAAARRPDAVLRAAVLGMLPKNNLRRAMARKLRIFPGPDHPFGAHPDLVEMAMPPRKLREKGDAFVLPEGFEALNPEAYIKRYGHRLARMQQGAAAAAAAAAAAGGQQQRQRQQQRGEEEEAGGS